MTPPDADSALSQGPLTGAGARAIPERAGLSAKLRALADHCEGQGKITLGTLVHAAKGRMDDLLLILLALPFLSPVPVPLLSTVLGSVVFLLGLRRATTWWATLPAGLLRTPLPPRYVRLTLTGAGRLLGFLEHFLSPRLGWLVQQPGWRCVSGLLIAVSGALLALPLPVPLSNFFPAVTVLLLAAGNLEQDGRAVLAGYGSFAVTILFFAVVAAVGVTGWNFLAGQWSDGTVVD